MQIKLDYSNYPFSDGEYKFAHYLSCSELIFKKGLTISYMIENDNFWSPDKSFFKKYTVYKIC